MVKMGSVSVSAECEVTHVEQSSKHPTKLCYWKTTEYFCPVTWIAFSY